MKADVGINIRAFQDKMVEPLLKKFHTQKSLG